MASYSWVEVVAADAVTYEPGDARFDAVHCRLVLMHQPDPQALVAHMIALTRPGGRVAVQEYDMDGPTDAPALICHPHFPALERVAAALWAGARQARGIDFHAGRKALARFGAAGLMSADEYESLLAESRAARQDPAFAHCLVRHQQLVATVGQKP